MTERSPYLVGLELVKQNHGTSGQTALAKCILSLYNPRHAFSMGEILGPLDSRYTKVVLGMVKEFADVGENEELCIAGRWVYEEFPDLIELSKAMGDARQKVRDKWENERIHQRSGEGD
jgi:hypothetical protein